VTPFLEKHFTQAEIMQRYLRTAKGRAARRRAVERYNNSAKGKAARQRYARSAKGRETAAANKRRMAILAGTALTS